MVSHKSNSVHQKPPEEIRELYKRIQKSDTSTDGSYADIINFTLEDPIQKFPADLSLVGHVPKDRIQESCSHLGDRSTQDAEMSDMNDAPIYECLKVPGQQLNQYPMLSAKVKYPGLFVIPSLVPLKIQCLLLDHLLHKALANPKHITNVHFHHELPYGEILRSNTLPKHGEHSSRAEVMLQDTHSFFDIQPDSPSSFAPKDLTVHRPFNITQFLQKKLRWVTLGAQYNWNEKVYPKQDNPPFPSQVASFIQGLFPRTIPEAAIVNLYSPGDTLSVHRDISEDSPNGLVSLSVGCEGLFVVGTDPKTDEVPVPICLRLRSGDAVYMDGPSRRTWHGVPKVIPGTCPAALCEWPARSTLDGEKYAGWRGWMASKRVNLNVRQL